MFFSQSPYENFQSRLGTNARLGISLHMIDEEGKIIKHDGFNNHLKMPMASTCKIAIALLTLKKVFDEKSLCLDDEIDIVDTDFSPGPPYNTLDRYFFVPWSVSERKTVDDLLTLMLKESSLFGCTPA